MIHLDVYMLITVLTKALEFKIKIISTKYVFFRRQKKSMNNLIKTVFSEQGKGTKPCMSSCTPHGNQ